MGIVDSVFKPRVAFYLNTDLLNNLKVDKSWKTKTHLSKWGVRNKNVNWGKRKAVHKSSVPLECIWWHLENKSVLKQWFLGANDYKNGG
jgi:hypothetical protein